MSVREKRKSNEGQAHTRAPEQMELHDPSILWMRRGESDWMDRALGGALVSLPSLPAPSDLLDGWMYRVPLLQPSSVASRLPGTSLAWAVLKGRSRCRYTEDWAPSEEMAGVCRCHPLGVCFLSSPKLTQSYSQPKLAIYRLFSSSDSSVSRTHGKTPFRGDPLDRSRGGM